METSRVAAPWPFMADALAEWFDTLSAGGIFMTDMDLRVQAWNRWLEVNTGKQAESVVGQDLLALFPDLAARGLDQFYRDALAGIPRVVSQGFHGHLLAMPDHAGHGVAAGQRAMMPQTARISPVRVGGRVVGTITVIDNVGERVASERELRSQIAALERARETAESALRSKDEFLATLSHELRTPLTAVLGWTRLLRTGQVDGEMVRRALEVIDRNAAAQAQLIDDMLDVARIMRGKMRLEMALTEVAPVVLAAVDAIRPAAEAKSVSVMPVLSTDDASVTADAGRLQQVVWNLLSNAVKFTATGGSVTVTVRADGPSVEIEVKDTGKGIAPEFLPFVFERFRQEDARTTRKYGGLGLGLSLVRQLVELHGGTVEARSEGEGRGAVFLVTLPLRPPATVQVARPGRPVDIDNALAGRRVLLVDDEDDARELLRVTLGRHGAEVTAVPSAAAALRQLSNAEAGRPPFDVLVSDIGMPIEDGYTLARTVRALDERSGRRLPAIAVTGYAGPEARARALEAGYDRHFAKPVDLAELVEAIRELLPSAGRM